MLLWNFMFSFHLVFFYLPMVFFYYFRCSRFCMLLTLFLFRFVIETILLCLFKMIVILIYFMPFNGKKTITSMLCFISAYFKTLFLISVLMSFTYHISLYIFSVGLSYDFYILTNVQSTICNFYEC